MSPRKLRAEIPRSVSLLRPGGLRKAEPVDLDPAPPLALVVDDDEVFRTVVRAYLEPADFRVAEAVDGPSALAMFESVAADVVLLDIRLPGMDGSTSRGASRNTRGASERTRSEGWLDR